jgi:predicted membrane protein
MAQSRRRLLSSQVVLGALIVLVGVLLLGQTTDFYDLEYLFDYIPSLFVLLGIYAMVRSGFRNVFGPLVIVAVAGAWQLVELGYVSGDEVWQFWPLFVVFFGLSLILGQLRGRRSAEAVGEDHVSALAVFGGSEKRSASTTFSGANLTALFGGTELDLRDAEVADPPAHVSAVALFGGVSVIVPRDWNVELDVLPILGGAADERPRREREHDDLDLVVSGFAAFGGVSIED